MKRLGLFSTLSGWNASPLPGYPFLSIKFTGTHSYTWLKRGTVRVKCLAQEHNTVPRPELEPRPLDPESGKLVIKPPRFPKYDQESTSISQTIGACMTHI